MKKIIIALFLLLSVNSYAVRPFVTDDARIVSKGQIEVEAWPEVNLVGDEQTYALQFMAGMSITEWFEFIVGSGGGFDRRTSSETFANPTISPKFLFLKAEVGSWLPGIALDLGMNVNWGRGSLYDDAISLYAIMIATWRFYDDWLNIHLNLGERSTRHNGVSQARNYWGLGLDIGVYQREYRLILESYAGDPMEAEAPRIAYQWGFRWLKSDYINYDLTFGTQKEPDGIFVSGDRREYWVQLGIRLLFDTKYTTNPGHEGAQGLFKRPI